MSEWKEYKLKDAPLEIIDGDRGKNYPPQEEFTSYGDCLFLSTKNVRFTGFDFSDCQFISKQRDELLRKGKLKRNDLVLTTRGTIGNIGFYSGNIKYNCIRINSGMVIIRPNLGELLPSFNYYVFRHLQKDFLTFTTGSAQPQLPIRDLYQIDIKVPSLPEQIQIASILSSLDDKIDLLHRQNITLEQLAETLFRQWFAEEADESWAVKTISDIIDVRDGTHDSPKQTSTGKHLITSKHLKPSGIDFATAYKISEEDFIEVNKRSKVDMDDILFSMIGTLGLIHYVDSEPDFAIKNMGLFKSSQKPKFANFFFLLLKGPIGQKFIHENAVGSTQEYITLGSLRNFEFNYPGEKLIIEFDLEVQPLFQKIKSNTTQIRTLTQLRDTLLPKLMSGEVRVKN